MFFGSFFRKESSHNTIGFDDAGDKKSNVYGVIHGSKRASRESEFTPAQNSENFH